MKKICKSLLFATLNVVLCAGLLLTANAQSNKSSSSGSSSSSSRPASSSSGSVRSSGGGGSPSFSRPAGSMMGQRSGAAQSNMNRQGAGGRPSYGYSPRQGGISMQPARNGIGSPQRQGVVTNQNFASRGLVNNTTRIGVTTTAVGFRNPALANGRRDFWGANNYNYHNHGYYKSGYLPRLGYRCTVLPYGYYPFFWGDAQYYYSDGFFYEYQDDEYTIVEPPIGAEVATLPSDAQSIVINGQQYYESAGVYYQPYVKDNGVTVYVVAGKDGELNTNPSVQDSAPAPPQIGDIVTQLPPNCRKIMVSGQKLFVSPDGIYYQPLVDANNITTYKIVGLPADQVDQN